MKTTVLAARWTVSDTEGATRVAERLSRKVAATSDSMPTNGRAWAHQVTPASAEASASVTTATTFTPGHRPSHCRAVTYRRSSGPACALMLLHKGALAAHGLKVFPDPVAHARDEAHALPAGATGC